jgi:hypothetical protein
MRDFLSNLLCSLKSIRLCCMQMLVKLFSVENSERVKEISMLDLKKKKLYYNILNFFFFVFYYIYLYLLPL